MAMRFQRKAAGRCKGERELQERGVPFSVGGGAYLQEEGGFSEGMVLFQGLGREKKVKGTWPFWRGIFHCRTEGSFYGSFEEATGRGFSVKVKSPLPFSRRFFLQATQRVVFWREEGQTEKKVQVLFLWVSSSMFWPSQFF